MRMLIPALVLVLTTANSLRAQNTLRPDADPRIEKLVAAISEERLHAIDEKLTSFVTRNTLSDTASPSRGIGAARQWIFDEMKRSSPKLQVSFDTYQLAVQGRIIREVELRNIVAVLPGKTSRRIYVTGHYDTVSIGPGGQIAANSRPATQGAAPDAQLDPRQDFNAAAPGANDDGSGTALTMELARVFAESGIDFDATLVFVCWAGEEQGLIGSRAHAQKIASEKIVVEAMFNNDIVGNSRGGNGVIDSESVRVYSAGPEDSMSRSLARYIQRIAAIYVPSHEIRLMAREDRFSRGSDHSSFTQHGYPAVAFRESNENFAMQHSANDTLDGVDFKYLARNARVNAASVASLALAPPAPKNVNERGQATIGRQPSGYDANLRWNASPGAVAYRIYWRNTWTNDWQHQQLVGNVTGFVLPNVAIDDYVFGVAAVGADGHESLVSAYVATQRRDTEVKFAK
jgi:pectin methylesterase-like acyl-CoA thioesterase